MSSRESCTCAMCVGCCEQKPGWMKPGEAERIAAFLGMSLDDLFRDYLAVDWWVGGFDEPDVYVLSPAIVGEETGVEFPYIAQGRCVFLRDGLCSIHAVKPFECAVSFCGDGPVDTDRSAHKEVADAWRADEARSQITTLLGRGPRSASGGGLFDLLSFLP